MKLDWWLVIPMALLEILGLVILRSVASEAMGYQLAFALISWVAFVIAFLVDFRVLDALRWPLFVIGIIFLLSPYFLGTHSRGALRWLQFGQIYIQPSEITKPIWLLTFANLASANGTWVWLWLVGAFAVPAGLVFLQPDLGTMMVMAAGWVGLFWQKLPWRWLWLVVGILISPAIWLFLHPYQRDRILTFVSPYRDPLGKGYHAIQSLIAVGSGQWWGRGLGQGTQSQLRFLPERHTDFIFASIAEELGFVGSLLALVLLGLLSARLMWIAQHANWPQARYFCRAVVVMLAFQTFVNVGMNTGIVPITGITLPFLSYGGSSLLSWSIIVGMCANISKQVKILPTFKIR